MALNGLPNGDCAEHWKSNNEQNDEVLGQFYEPVKGKRNAELDLIDYVKRKRNVNFGKLLFLKNQQISIF